MRASVITRGSKWILWPVCGLSPDQAGVEELDQAAAQAHVPIEAGPPGSLLGGASCALGAWLLDSELDRKHGAARSTFEASTRLHDRVGGGILPDFVTAQLDFLQEHRGLRVVVCLTLAYDTGDGGMFPVSTFNKLVISCSLVSVFLSRCAL